MKKFLLILGFIILSTVLVFTACAKNNVVAEELPPEEEEEIIEEDVVEDEPSSDTSLSFPVSMNALQSYMSPIEGLAQDFYLLRDNKAYHLGMSSFDTFGITEITAEIPSGSIIGDRFEVGIKATEAYTRTLFSNTFKYNDKMGFFSLGNIPVPVLQANDLVVSYSSESVPKMKLYPVEFYGTGIPILRYNDHSVLIYLPFPSNLLVENAPDNGLLMHENVSNLKIVDLNGNEASDYYNLSPDTDYIMQWFEGTQYREQYLWADCKFYIFKSPDADEWSFGDPDYEIDGTLTKDGYATYDLSGVAPGLYTLRSDNSWSIVIEIK